MSKWKNLQTGNIFDSYEEARNEVSNYISEDDVCDFILENIEAEVLVPALNEDIPSYYQKMRGKLTDKQCIDYLVEIPNNTTEGV